ncbi:MAG: oligopeptide:H+ symporter [Holophagales bacterium]|nr:oligopeptide:H+ symporter [Holophagales bacterium]
MSDAASKQWFGHPRALSTLFFTEMWERFSYYGMRAILALFMTAPAAAGGLGWPAEKAGPIYGLYTAMVYVTALPGGWIADRLIGQRNAVLIGGIIITLGHVSLMFHGLGAFYLGLFLIVVGTGFLKPNISALVGQLYEEGDARRDAGFSIFYMGINVGAFASPLVCGWLAQHESFKQMLQNAGFDPVASWHWGFGAAAVGMALGVVQYLLGETKLGTAFQWLAVALLLGFGIFVAVVSGSTEVELLGQLAAITTPIMVGGVVVATIAIFVHLLWLIGAVIWSAEVGRLLLWGSVGSLGVMLAITGLIYSGQQYSVAEPVSELVPRHDLLVGVMVLAILGVLFYAVQSFRHGQRTYGAIGVLVAAGLAFSKLDRIAEPSTVLLVVRTVGFALPAFSYVYFARLFSDSGWNDIERKRIYAIPVFFLGAAVFWSAFEQAGTTLNLFADRFTHNQVFGFVYPSSWFQSVNSLFIILLAPVFAWAWVKLAEKKREPSSPMKFAIGLYLLGVGFAVLGFAAVISGPGGGLVGPQWLFTVYLFHTLGELCLSPVGLSTMTKLAPKQLAGQMMGVWFLGTAVGNFIGGIVAGFFESLPLPLLFGAVFGTTILATIAMLMVVEPVRRLMSGVS